MDPLRLVPVILLAMLAACGGGPSSTTGLTNSQVVASPSVGDGGAPGDAPASAGAGSGADFCSLLTNAEVEDATGYPVLSAEPSDIGCVWKLDPGNQLPGLEHVSVLVHDPGGRERFAFLETGGHEALPGIGDGALKTNSNTGGTIWALSGDRLLTWNFTFGIDTDDPIPLVLPLVEQAIASE